MTLPYCFLNTEIRNVVRCHWQRYQTQRYAVDQTQHTRVPGSARNSLSMYHNYNNNNTAGSGDAGAGHAHTGKGFMGRYERPTVTKATCKLDPVCEPDLSHLPKQTVISLQCLADTL